MRTIAPLGFFEPGGIGSERDVGFYLALQAGVLFSAGVADIGPRGGEPDWFPQADLQAGLSF